MTLEKLRYQGSVEEVNLLTDRDHVGALQAFHLLLTETNSDVLLFHFRPGRTYVYIKIIPDFVYIMLFKRLLFRIRI